MQLVVYITTFNRTNLELKPRNKCIEAQANGNTFNRTNLELKHMPWKYPELWNKLLIEPIWN